MEVTIFIPYSNPEFDNIVAATQTESDPAKFQQLVDDGIELLDREVPMIIFGSLFVIDAWYDYVHPGRSRYQGRKLLGRDAKRNLVDGREIGRNTASRQVADSSVDFLL